MSHSYQRTYVFESGDLQKLREEMHRALDLRFDQFLQSCRIVEISSSSAPIPWLKSKEDLLLFYNLLSKYNYIDCTWEYFRIHFIGDGALLSKIFFLKPINQLPYIFDCLQKLGFVAKCDHPHIRLVQHFDRLNNPIDHNVLRVSLEKGVGEKTKEFIEKEIISELKNYNG